MKSFHLKGKYIPATAILAIEPPHGYKHEVWTVHLIGGSTIELVEATYRESDVEALKSLVEFFEIPGTIAPCKQNK